jgi:hypothetical protein
MRGRLRSLATLGATLGVLFAGAAPAMATTEQFLVDQWLGNGPVAFASTSAHTSVDNAHKDSLTTYACPAVASGYAGGTVYPNSYGNFTAADNCGTGERTWHPAGTAGYTFHGAVYNPNTTSDAHIWYARYTW